MNYVLIPLRAAIDLNAAWGLFLSLWFWVHVCEKWYLCSREILDLCEVTPEVAEDSLLGEVSAQRCSGFTAFRQLSIFSAVKIWKASIQTEKRRFFFVELKKACMLLRSDRDVAVGNGIAAAEVIAFTAAGCSPS